MSRIFLLSLGCARNQVDSEKVLSRLGRRGHEIVLNARHSDVVIINTCAFIDAARRESVEAIDEALRLKSAGRVKKVLVYGCLAKLYWRDLFRWRKDIDALAGVDIINDNPWHYFLGKKHTAFIKISEGCPYRCSYCRIPEIKGRMRSRSASSILKEVKWLDSQGVSELNIVAQDTTAWGRDLPGERDFSHLLNKISKAVRGIKWIRVLYAHPRSLSRDTIEAIASLDNVCNYIDLPLQHINDRILKLMRRRTTRKSIERILITIRRRIPEVSLRTTFIVGFPTEKESEFKELLLFVKDFGFDNLGVFIYSDEKGTPSFGLRKVSLKRKRERFERLINTQRYILPVINGKFTGKEFDVLVDNISGKYCRGRIYADAYDVDRIVKFKNKGFLREGDFIRKRIMGSREYVLRAE